jgi:hypothetical protein
MTAKNRPFFSFFPSGFHQLQPDQPGLQRAQNKKKTTNAAILGLFDLT